MFLSVNPDPILNLNIVNVGLRRNENGVKSEQNYSLEILNYLNSILFMFFSEFTFVGVKSTRKKTSSFFFPLNVTLG